MVPKIIKFIPRNIFLFSGHMVDRPDRKEPRFPPKKEVIVAQKISKALDDFQAGSEDIALCGGACGGDLLFAEACLKRNIKLEIRIPFDEATFIKNSISFAGEKWVERFYQAVNHDKTSLMIMPEELGPLPEKEDPYARNNLWQLFTALAWGLEKINFICLWNRKTGDGPGGTEHMYNTVSNYSRNVKIIGTNHL